MQIPYTQDPPGLLPFLALAALLHALLLALPLADGSPMPERVLRIALAPSEAAPPALARPAAPRPPPAPTRTSALSPSAPRLPPTAPPIAAATAPQAAAAPQESARVLSQIRSALARHFTYPLLAQRRGWQGEVLLGFSVTPEGRIDGVEVVRSSGHRLLDEAARTSLARIGSLPEYVSHGSEPLSLQLPIIYRLAEG